MNSEVQAGALCCCVSVVVIIVFVCMTCKVVLPTQIAVEYNWVSKTVSDTPLADAGMHVRGPWISFVTYPKTVENIEFDETHHDILDGRTRDGLPIIVGVTLQYQLIPEEVVKLYKEFEQDQGDYLQLFKLHAIHVITEEACKYNASEFFNDKIRIAANMHTVLDKHFKEKLHARIDALQLNSETLPEDFTKTVLQASAERQNIAKAQNTLQANLVSQQTNIIVANYEAHMTVLQAQGNASYIEKAGDADAAIINTFFWGRR